MNDEQKLMIAGLRDLHLPQPISWWPLAPGWWIVIIILLSLIAFVVWWRARHRYQRAPRQQAMTALLNAYQQWKEDDRLDIYLQRSHHVLRQMAITLAGRENVSQLCAEQWADWLDSQVEPTLSHPARQALAYGAYQPQFAVPVEQLHSEYMRWVKHA